MKGLENENFGQLERKLLNKGPRATNPDNIIVSELPEIMNTARKGQNRSNEQKDGEESSAEGHSNRAIPLKDNNKGRNLMTDPSDCDSPLKKIRLDKTPKSVRKSTQSIAVSSRSQKELFSNVEELGLERISLVDDKTDEENKNEVATQTIKELLIENNAFKRKALKEKTAMDFKTIGYLNRTTEMKGRDIIEIERKLDELSAEKDEIASALAVLRKRKPVPAKSSENGSKGADDTNDLTVSEYIEQEEIYKMRIGFIKRSEAELKSRLESLKRSASVHFRELRRQRSEQDSRFQAHQMLNERYLLLSLLGKGGFSEVWKAYDLHDKKSVACKMHRVESHWEYERKINHVMHAKREAEIQSSLKHRRIVPQSDKFKFDKYCFVTVLEYCEGYDLDLFLKQNGQLSEKDARVIVMQIVSALKYLSEQDPPIIHYDLKPQNIMLESGKNFGAIKISDFGLSKLIRDTEDGYIELTSQGCGTMGYLPKETHDLGAKISNKVDIWSTGVIFYECLYGRRPFGHGRSKDEMKRELIDEKEVEFPAQPKVSAVALDFIRRCLTHNVNDRADVTELCAHELFKSRSIKLLPTSPISTNPCAMEE